MKTILIFLFLSLLCFNEQSISQNGKLSVLLNLDKDSYHEDELMTVNLKFTNNDTTDFTLWHNCSLEDDILYSLEFKDDRGVVYKLSSRLTVDCIGRRIIIMRGKSFETGNIKVTIDKSHRFKNFDYLPKGSYTVTSTFPAVSNSVAFKVIEK
jgi:hypothetical protein